MKLLHVMRNSDTPGGGGADQDPFAKYEGAAKIEGEVTEKPASDKKTETTETKLEVELTEEEKAAAAAEAKKNADGTPKAGTEEKEKPGDNETNDEGFTAEDLEIKDITKVEDENYSFIEIASEIGFKTEEDSIDGLKTGLKEHIQQQRQEAVSEYLERQKKYSPDAMRLIDAFNSGLTETELFTVQQGYIDALAMTDEEKIILQATSNNLTEEEGRARYNDLVENGTLEEAIENINNALRTQMVKVRNEKINQYQQKAIDKKASDDALAQKENTLILEAITNRNSFMGVPITPEVKKVLAARWNSGVYRNAFSSDPNKVVDFILTMEFGEKVASKRVKVAASDTKKELHGKLSNLEDAKSQSSKAGQQDKAPANIDPNDPFKHYKGLDDTAEYRVNHVRN